MASLPTPRGIHVHWEARGKSHEYHISKFPDACGHPGCGGRVEDERAKGVRRSTTGVGSLQFAFNPADPTYGLPDHYSSEAYNPLTGFRKAKKRGLATALELHALADFARRLESDPTVKEKDPWMKTSDSPSIFREKQYADRGIEAGKLYRLSEWTRLTREGQARNEAKARAKAIT